MSVSVTIMAHPKRKKFVTKLKPELAGAGAVWDRSNDRWDTGRRALLTFDQAADWHLVVQDDAILCDSFLQGVEKALASVPLEHPVSFYTGKVQPYAGQIKRIVYETQMAGKSWFAMRGPLWGVAVAIPTAIIPELVTECDKIDIANYDMRMAMWFQSHKRMCWYSVPSLVNHRTGPENPSLVPERGGHPGRQALQFIDKGDPLAIDWDTGAYMPGDPSEPWTEDGTCTVCWEPHDSLPEAIVHAYMDHNLGKVDFLASTPYHAEALAEIRDLLPEEVRGNFYVVGADVSQKVDEPHTKLNRRDAANKLRRLSNGFTIVGASRDLKYLTKKAGWSLVEAVAN